MNLTALNPLGLISRRQLSLPPIVSVEINHANFMN